MRRVASYDVGLALVLVTIARASIAAPPTQATGTISGTVTDGSLPVAAATVSFLTSAGAFVGFVQTNASGVYTSPGLPGGSYYVRVAAPFGSGLIDELYNNVPCPDANCALTAGTTVSVTAGAGTLNIDFSLAAGGWFQGTITNEQTGAPVAEAYVRVYSAAGSVGFAPLTPPSGAYRTNALLPGTYYLEVFAPGLKRERYENIFCVAVDCPVTTAVGVPMTIPGGITIDFALAPGPSVTVNPPSTVVWEGQTATFTATAVGEPLPSGQWQVSVDGGATWADVYGATSTTYPAAVSTTYAFSTGRADNGKRVRAVFTNAGGTTTTTAATLTVSPCEFSLSPVAIAPYTGASSSITVQTGAGCTFVAVSNASWLTLLNGASGVGFGMVGYSVSPYTGTVPRTGTITIGGHPVEITQSGIPTMTMDKTSLAFSVTTNGSALLASTPPQTVRLTQNVFGRVTWIATSSHPGVWVSPASGVGPAMLSVGVSYAAGVPSPGTTDGAVTLTFTGAANAGAELKVTLNVIPDGRSEQPFGRIDTPLDGATGIAGSIAVTGWALDDLGVTRLLILRDPVAGEGSEPVYIGDATFLDGARPDVQAAHQTYPQSSRAGWGYMLLTNFLPARGNGRFKLYAAAVDVEGRVTTLASTTITCDNANSNAPFGAIDTPGQGETWSGVRTNYGWVLSPGSRRADPPGGGIVNVFIDGVNVGSPTGWGARSDITALFPPAEYQGVSTAVGGFGVDTRLLSNGVHSIFWVVTASSGGSAGVGSRYFTVANAQVFGLRQALRSGTADVSEIVNRAPVDLSTIRGRRGFDLQSALTDFVADDGRTLVQAEELDRVELRLAMATGHTFTGYLRTIDGLGPLPAGSALDGATGTFTWGAGPGFIGAYDLTFVRWSNGEAVARQDVRVVLNPKGSNRVGPQVVIDVPLAGQGRPAVVDRSFFLSGWAIDLDSPADRGVDGVHVWAYPVDTTGAYQPPRFLGPANFGGSRRDVGTLYGARFETSGYGMIVTNLPRGTYDIAVFAHSTVRGDFVPAQTVRVTVR